MKSLWRLKWCDILRTKVSYVLILWVQKYIFSKVIFKNRITLKRCFLNVFFRVITSNEFIISHQYANLFQSTRTIQKQIHRFNPKANTTFHLPRRPALWPFLLAAAPQKPRPPPRPSGCHPSEGWPRSAWTHGHSPRCKRERESGYGINLKIWMNDVLKFMEYIV